MADPIIRVKRSSVPGKIPNETQVPLGEIALNTYDGKVFASKNVGIGTTVFVVNPWTVGAGTDVYNTYFTNGNVGIGTTLPTSKLHVVGNSNFTGVVTASNSAVIKSGTATTALLVEGHTRIIGILTVGSSSITLDGDVNQVNVGAGVTIHHINGFQIGENTLHTSGLTLNHVNLSGITTLGTVKISSGIVTSTSPSGIVTYYGDGRYLQNILSGVGVATAGGLVGTGATILDFRGAGISTVTVSSGIATINITGGGGGSASVAISTQAPSSPSAGNLWYNSDLGRIFIYYNDTTSSQWVDAAPFNLNLSELDDLQVINLDVSQGTTLNRLNVSGISTLGNVVIGSGTTDLIVNGNARVTGILTIGTSSLTLNGNTNQINGVTISSGIITASSFSGNLTGTATGLSGTPNITVGNITGAAATFTGNVSIAGTLTYEDVTNVDSVGLVTARSGAHVATSSGSLLVGTTSSTGTASQRLQVTGGTYVSGNVGVGNTNPQYNLDVAGDINFTGTFRQNGTQFVASRWTAGTGNDIYRLNGNVGIGTTNPIAELQLSPNASISNLNISNNFGTTAGATATVAQFRHGNGNASYLRIKATRNTAGSNWTTASTKLLQVIDATEMGYIEYNPNGANLGMAFGQGATEWARFLSTGNLGIGVTNPSDKLHTLGGNIRVDSATGAVNFWSGAGYYGGIGVAGGMGGSGTDIVIRSDTSRSIIFYTGGANDRGRIDSNGNLGIGTNNPLQRLHVQGNLLVAAGSSTAKHITQRAYELNNGTLSWEGSAGQLFSITNNLTSGSIFSVNDVSGIPSIDVDANGTIELAPFGGNVGVGLTNPTTKLHVIGTITCTDINSTSDVKLKDNIQTFENALETIQEIRGVRFDWKENQKPSVGVVAQEVEKVLPELVADTETKSVNYNGLIGVLIEAVKEQQEQINTLKKEIEELKNGGL